MTDQNTQQLAKKSNEPEILDVTAEDLDARLAAEYRMDEVNNIIIACSPAQLLKRSAFDQAIILASGMAQIRAIFNNSPMQGVLMTLMGTKLGFTTDKDRSKNGERYGWDTVRDVIIEAALKGLRPVNNEITIIAGNLYAGQTGVTRLVREFPGLTDLQPSYGMPQMVETAKGFGCVVKCSATWKMNGENKAISAEIPIKGDEWSSVDQYLGKAVTKLHKRIYNILMGSDTLPDDDDSEPNPFRAEGGRLVPNVINREEAVLRAREGNLSAPETQVVSGKTLSPQGGPKKEDKKEGRPGPRRDDEQTSAPGGGAASQTNGPTKEGEPSANEQKWIAAEEWAENVAAGQLREFIKGLAPDVLKEAKAKGESNLDEKATEKEWRRVAAHAKYALSLIPKAPEQSEAELMDVAAKKFVENAAAKAKGVEKALQKIGPVILESAKKVVGFTGNVAGRKDEELKPLLYECCILEYKSREQK